MKREAFVVEQVWADGDVEVSSVHTREDWAREALEKAEWFNAKLPREGVKRTARLVRYEPATEMPSESGGNDGR